MKPEEQRIAIAEACGYSLVGFRVYKKNGTVMGEFIGIHDSLGTCLPDYCNDLNAMHAAEKWLFQNHGDLWSHYITAIERITGSLSSIHATAPQRAEALLRTLNLWKP